MLWKVLPISGMRAGQFISLCRRYFPPGMTHVGSPSAVASSRGSTATRHLREHHVLAQDHRAPREGPSESPPSVLPWELLVQDFRDVFEKKVPTSGRSSRLPHSGQAGLPVWRSCIDRVSETSFWHLSQKNS